MLIVFHFDMSGKDNKAEELENISLISLTLKIFHLEISGKEVIFEQL